MSAEAHPHPGGEHPETAAEHPAPAHHPKAEAAAHPAPQKHGGEAKTHAPAKAPAPARDKSPVGSFLSKTQMEADNAGNSVISSTTKFGELVRKVLRAEVQPVEGRGIIQTPFYAAGHALDATALNAGRRAVEAVEPVISGIRAFCRLTIGNILHPINMLVHPVERILKPAIRMVTSVTRSSINQVKIPVRAIDDLADRGVNRITQQVNHQVSRIPVLGKLFSTPTNWITKQISHITAGVRRAVDFVTSPVDALHDAVAPA